MFRRASVGAKLIGVDLSSKRIIKTIIVLRNVGYPDSYNSDTRFDPHASIPGSSGQGV